MIRKNNLRSLLLLAIVVNFTGCANPLNSVTYDRYWQQGVAAEKAEQLGDAEQAYYRALVNVDSGNLGPVVKAQALYNLGRIKRRAGKYAEAEDLLKQSLVLKEKHLNPDDLDTARCRIELSVVLAAQDKWEEGSRYLEGALAHATRFTGGERQFLSEVLRRFSDELRKKGLSDKARQFEQPTTK